MTRTKPYTPWLPRDRFSASHLNESVNSLRTLNLSVRGGTITSLPNGTTVGIPSSPFSHRGLIGVVNATGPGGEADFANENYWIYLQYFIADKWGTVVDIEKDYPGSGADLSNIIVPATSLTERKPGGPAGVGTHTFPIGFPVFLWAIKGRTTSPTDTTAVQRFVFFGGGVDTKGQYQEMGKRMITDNQSGWSYDHAHAMNG